MSLTPRALHGFCAVLAALVLSACSPGAGIRTPSVTVPSASAPAPTAPFRERLAALTRRQTDFGAISLIPVRFEHSRISQPFVDEGRTLYCVSTRMKGRSLDGAERPKIVVREADGVLTVVNENAEICEGHRTEAFPELDTPAAGKS